MATVSGQNTQNKIKVSNNQARYYSEVAGSYAQQAGTEATLAANWAIKTDGTVDGSEYSSKYYAQLAANTVNSALTDIDEERNLAISSVQAELTASISTFTETTQATLTTAINTLTMTAEATTTSAINTITATAATTTTNAINSINNKKTESLSILNATTDACKTSITNVYSDCYGTITATASSTIATMTALLGSTEAAKTEAENCLTTIQNTYTEAMSVIPETTSGATVLIETTATEKVSIINATTEACKTEITNLSDGYITTITSLGTSATQAIETTKQAAISTISANVATTSANVDKSKVWAEGTDEQVQALGGTHSAKEWCLYNSSVNQNDVRALQGASVLGAIFRQGDSDSINSRLDEIKRYAHSTFDRSKFTVVGSPNITDDGVASGFSSSNYITIDTSSIDWTKPYRIKVICNFANLTNSNQNLTVNDMPIIRLHDGKLEFSPATSFSQISSVGAIVDTVNPTVNVDYIIEAEFSGTNYTFRKSIDGGETFTVIGTKTTSEIVTDLTTGGTSVIGGYSGDDYRAFSGSIDLKQFSITVDGVEVFSGNKTGIDTIKPDDYTVVGTPTISADGIASGFSGSNFLRFPTLNLSNITDLEFISPVFKLNELLDGQYQNLFILPASGDSTYMEMFVANNSTNIQFAVTNGGEKKRDKMAAISGSGSYVPNTTDIFQVKIKYKNGIWSFYQNINNAGWTKAGSDHEDANPVNLATPMNIGREVPTVYLHGSADINTSKFIVNGDIVYQPCLMIPYTESKTGSKIVDALYRDRVNDMAEQFGYANYYTLDEDNGNFTLPQVELYGLIGQRTLRDSYRNGATYWELWSDRTLEIGGTCTSGVEYNLPKNFTSENDYILSVPYSAKTASSFTPTVSGDFIAKGLGVL